MDRLEFKKHPAFKILNKSTAALGKFRNDLGLSETRICSVLHHLYNAKMLNGCDACLDNEFMPKYAEDKIQSLQKELEAENKVLRAFIQRISEEKIAYGHYGSGNPTKLAK